MLVKSPKYHRFFYFLILTIACAEWFGCQRDQPDARQTLTVFAAASLASVLPQIAEAFQKDYPNIKIKHNFAASSLLAKQIEQGANADIYLSANRLWVNYLANKKLIHPEPNMRFLSNELVFITTRKASYRLNGLTDLIDPGIQKIALADWTHVPAGIYAKATLEKFSIWQKVKSKCIPALDVRAALTYVERGEADCGIVYRSDALLLARNIVLTNFITKELQPEIYYYMAVVQNSKHPLNSTFMSFLKSSQAAEIFVRNGFVTPTVLD